MTKILLVTSSLHGGGAEFVARSWIQWLHQNGFETQIFLVSDGKRLDLAGDIFVEKASAGLSTRAVTAALRAKVLSWRPEIVLSLQTHPNLIALAAVATLPKARKPAVVISERNLVTLGIEGSSLSHRAKILAAKQTYRFADMMIAISHPVAAEMVAGFGVRGDHCLVVPNPATAKVKEFRRFEGGARESLRIVVPGRLVEQKRPLLVIKAAIAARNLGEEVSVETFGTGPLENDMTELAARNGIPLVHHGWVEDWFEASPPDGVALLASLREGFGNVLVEAAAVGLPSVAISGALGVADAIVPGITGELAFDDSPESIAQALIAAKKLDLSSIDPWMDRFSISSSGELLQRALTIVLEKQRGSK